MFISNIIGYVFKQPLTGFWATSGVVALIIGLALHNIRMEENTQVVIPNSLISTYVVSNFHNSGFPTRFEVFLTIDYSIPVKRVKRVLLAGVKEVLNCKAFVADREPSVLVDEANDLGVQYRVRFWIAKWKRMSPSRSPQWWRENILNPFQPSKQVDQLSNSILENI